MRSHIKKSTERIMLVSRAYTAPDFYTHLEKIVNIANEQKCSILLFPGWSLDLSHEEFTHAQLFKKNSSLKYICFERANLETEFCQTVYLFCHDKKEPIIFYRKFSTSTATKNYKEGLVADLSHRTQQEKSVIICGEVNILHYSRKNKKMLDEFRIHDELERLQISTILCPWHYQSRRPELSWKKKDLSRGRLLVSVWNHSYSPRESKIPWICFKDGENIKSSIIEIPTPFADRPDIRLGIL